MKHRSPASKFIPLPFCLVQLPLGDEGPRGFPFLLLSLGVCIDTFLFVRVCVCRHNTCSHPPSPLPAPPSVSVPLALPDLGCCLYSGSASLPPAILISDPSSECFLGLQAFLSSHFTFSFRIMWNPIINLQTGKVTQPIFLLVGRITAKLKTAFFVFISRHSASFITLT